MYFSDVTGSLLFHVCVFTYEIKGTMGVDKLPLPLPFSVSLLIIFFPRRYLSPRTHRFKLIRCLLSPSHTHTYTETLLEAVEHRGAVMDWFVFLQKTVFLQKVCLCDCLINEWLSFIQLTEIQFSVRDSVSVCA